MVQPPSNFVSRQIFPALIEIKPADNLDARVARRYHARMVDEEGLSSDMG
jgi:hypothetical protein